MPKTRMPIPRSQSKSRLSVKQAAILLVKNVSKNASVIRVAVGQAQLNSRAFDAGAITREPAAIAKPSERHTWHPHEIEVLLRVAKDHPVGAVVPKEHLLQLLGWDRIPDPKKHIVRKVERRFYALHYSLQHGVDPSKVGLRKAYTKNRANTWTVWIRKALESLPGRQGSMSDVCAFMEADPDIAPKLDRRPYENSKSVPKWRRSVCTRIATIPGVIATEKRGLHRVYRYEPENAVVGRVRKRASKRGQAGAPYMGKKSQRAN